MFQREVARSARLLLREIRLPAQADALPLVRHAALQVFFDFLLIASGELGEAIDRAGSGDGILGMLLGRAGFRRGVLNRHFLVFSRFLANGWLRRRLIDSVLPIPFLVELAALMGFQQRFPLPIL